MATNKELFEEINDRLHTVETKLKLRTKSSWLGERYEWAVNHKGTSLILAVILCGLGIFGGGYFKYWLDHKNDAANRAIDERINSVLGVPGGIKETLSKVEQTTSATDTTLRALSPFIQDVIRHQFESASKLSTKALQERLPAMQDLVTVAKNQGVKVPADVTENLSKKLLQIDPTSSDLWQAAGALISYRSFNTTSWALPPGFPNCTDLVPVTQGLVQSGTAGGEPIKVEAKLAFYKDCRVTLDSPVDGRKLNELLTVGYASITFIRCLVVYRGDPVAVILRWENHVVDRETNEKGGGLSMTTSGNTLYFTDCLFDFSIEQRSPPQSVQQLARTVLSQTGTTIQLPRSPVS
jgi:hypothetical protein